MQQTLLPVATTSLDMLTTLSQLYKRYYQIVRIYYVFNIWWAITSCALMIIFWMEYCAYIALQIIWILFILMWPSLKSNADASRKEIIIDLGMPIGFFILLMIRITMIGIPDNIVFLKGMAIIFIVVDQGVIIALCIKGRSIAKLTAEMDREGMYHVMMPSKELPQISTQDESDSAFLSLSMRDFHVDQSKLNSPTKKLKDSNGFQVEHIETSFTPN